MGFSWVFFDFLGFFFDLFDRADTLSQGLALRILTSQYTCRMSANSDQTRERIVAAAARLFYNEGIRAASVDAIAEKAGVTKKTLYYHFRSKDELIAAYLESRDQPTLDLRPNFFRHGLQELGRLQREEVIALVVCRTSQASASVADQPTLDLRPNFFR